MSGHDMDFLFGLLPDFYREFFEDKDMLLEVWDGYKSKFVDEYSRLYELARSISLPRAPFVHREYYGSLTFDLSTKKDKYTYSIDNNIVKIEQLSEYPDPDRANFFLEDGKDYRIKIDEDGNRLLEFIQTTKVVISFTYVSSVHPDVPLGTKFFVNGRYIQITGDDGVGYYIRTIDDATGDETNPLVSGASLEVPDDLVYVSDATISTVYTDYDSYVDRIGMSPIPQKLYAYRISRDTHIIESNFGSFIDYKNTRNDKDMSALRSVIYNGEDPSAGDFSLENNNLTVVDNQIIHSPSRALRDLELYKLRVNALWFALWNGPSEFNLNVAASIFVGLPISELEGEVKSSEKDYGGRWVVTISNGSQVKEYTLPKNVSPSVTVGDPIALFQPIAKNAAKVYDLWIDEARFKTALQDSYSLFTDNMEEGCGVIFDDVLSFDSDDPCDRIYFDACEPKQLDEPEQYCYREDDLSRERYSALVYTQYDETHLRIDTPIPVIGGHFQVHDIVTGKVGQVWLGGYGSPGFPPDAVEMFSTLPFTVSDGSAITFAKDQLFSIEDDIDCNNKRSCLTVYDDPNNPGETITVGNYPDDFYKNFRYVFLLDVLGATSVLGSDFDAMYDFLYRIKPSYAHFVINMVVPAVENISLEADMTLVTNICELYDEKQVFFDNYESDAPDSGEDLYDYAKEGKGVFFDDPRLCIVNIFDSGDTETALTDDLDIKITEYTANQIDLGSTLPSP